MKGTPTHYSNCVNNHNRIQKRRRCRSANHALNIIQHNVPQGPQSNNSNGNMLKTLEQILQMVDDYQLNDIVGEHNGITTHQTSQTSQTADSLMEEHVPIDSSTTNDEADHTSVIDDTTDHLLAVQEKGKMLNFLNESTTYQPCSSQSKDEE